MGDGFEITCTASSLVARGGKQKNVELALPACKKLALMDKGLQISLTRLRRHNRRPPKPPKHYKKSKQKKQKHSLQRVPCVQTLIERKKSGLYLTNIFTYFLFEFLYEFVRCQFHHIFYKENIISNISKCLFIKMASNT